MKFRFSLILLFIILAACTPLATPPAPTLAPTITPTLREVQIDTTPAPDPTIAARAYLDAWVREDYPAMYALLTPLSQKAISAEAFQQFYANVATEAALKNWEYTILSDLVSSVRSAQVAYQVTLHSVLVGDLVRQTSMNLSFEQGAWLIQWDEGLLMPELRSGNYLLMQVNSPARANIYDRNGNALVAQADAVAIGLDSGKVDPETENSLLGELYRLTGVRPETIQPKLEAWRDLSLYIPVGDVSAEDLAPYESSLMGYAGVLLTPFRGRYYFGEGLAPHVVGYVSVIQKEQVDEYKRLGYNVMGDRVGQKGLEAWGEEYLAGKRGGILFLVGADGKIITRLAETETQPAQAIYTTLDSDLQTGAQAAMSKYRGAVVVLERDTGRVLAMASSPGFNPNLFEPQNYNRSEQINDLFDQDTLPLLNRATQGQYPLGSVFKIITMAAALQSGVYTTEDEYNCRYTFDELQGVTLYDWTWSHFQEDGKTQPSGILTLPEGLMRSCNPWFWHIGLDLFNRGMTKTISEMARGFGLGSSTGFELSDQPGNIPDPTDRVSATNSAIGQGATLVTPLQVANFIAALGNGGKLMRPSVVEKIVPPVGSPTYVFTPTVNSTLPISDSVRLAIQEAMLSVISNRRGTANFVLAGFSNNNNIPIYGKTGTAETDRGVPHAWFAGYTDANREGYPDIAVVVVAEYGGEGSQVAAPIFKRIMEIYFLGRPVTRYPWETSIGVVPTPTPLVTDTPPAEEATPTP